MRIIPLLLLLITNVSFSGELVEDSLWPTTIEKSWPTSKDETCLSVRFVHLNFCVPSSSFDRINVVRVDELSPLNISFTKDDKLLSFMFHTNEELFSISHIKDSLAKINVTNIKEKFKKIGMISDGNKMHIFWRRNAHLDTASTYIHYAKNNFDAYWVVSKDRKLIDELSIIYKSKSGYELYSISGNMTPSLVSHLLSTVKKTSKS